MTVPAAPPPPECFNAYLDGETVCLLRRDGDVVRREQHRAEYVTYVRASEMPANLEALLRGNSACRSMRREGEWLRISWRDQWVRRDVVRGKRDGKPSPFAAMGVTFYEGDVDPVRRYITDRGVRIQKPRRCYLDIETDSRVPFSRREEARILSWSIVGEDAVGIAGKTKMPDPNDPEGFVNDPAAVERFFTDPIASERCAVTAADTNDAEAECVGRMWEALADYDQILVWGSPFGKSHEEIVVPARTVLLNLKVDPRRWLFVDHLRLFARMNQHTAESGAEKRSMKLDAIAKAKLGAGKADFDAARTYEAWATAPCASGKCDACRACMLRYNCRDTRCLPGIESRTGFAALFDAVAEACRVVPDTLGLLPTRQMDGFMLRLGLEHGHHFPTKRGYKEVDEDADEEQYAGAYVMQPSLRGIGRDVHVGDFKSLYPAIILTWNMSPDTKVTRVEDVVALGEKAGKEVVGVRIMPGEPLPENTCRAPGTGQCFRTDVEGFLPMALRTMLALRAEWSERKSQCAPGTPAWVEADKRSTAYKVVANSFYGVVGSRFGRYYDPDVAEGITLTGAWLAKLTRDESERPGSVIANPMMVGDRVPTAEQLAEWSARASMGVVYMDTDSLFVTGSSERDFGTFVKWCNAELYPRLIAATGAKRNDIKLAYEKQFDRLVFTSAKRYVGYYVHYNGKRAKANSEPEVKGLEYKRGDTNLLAMRMQKKVIDLLRAEDDPGAYRDVVSSFLSHILFDELPPEEVVVSQAIKKPLSEYAVKQTADGDGEDLAHVKVAKILIARGREIGEGSRIEYVVTDGAKSPMEVAPAEDLGAGAEVDRYHLWEKKVYPPTQRLLEAAFPESDWGRGSGFERVRPAPKARGKALSGQEGLRFASRIDVPTAVLPRAQARPLAPVVSIAPVRLRVDGYRMRLDVVGELRALADAHPGARPLVIEVHTGEGVAVVDCDARVGDAFEDAAAQLLFDELLFA